MPTGKLRESLSFDWGVSHAYDAEIRSKELADRVWWFITMRWFAVGFCVLGAITIGLGILPFAINPWFFLISAVFLAVTNTVYFESAKIFTGEPINQRAIRAMLITQVLTDFFTLSLITYASGSASGLILILYLPHVILVSLFFPRILSLAMTVIGAVFAGVPAYLIRAGLSFSSLAHFFALLGCYLVSWYLVSEITTSLRTRELQLEDAHKKLILLDKEKTQATLRATHELKAPFAAIKSFVYTLRDGYCGELPEKAQVVVTRIGERCDMLMKKITDIIHLSNLKTLVIRDMHFTEIDLSAFVRREIQDSQQLAEQHGVVINDLTGDDPSFIIRASQEHLHTMLSNLLRNAVVYSKKGGVVEVTLRAKSDRVSVRVLDHGIGIPKENIPKIFDEHFRSNNAVEHHPNGTGMGLPMVKEIARLHGAVIHVSSDLGVSTHFTITFGLIEVKPKGGNYGEGSDH